MSEQQPMAFAVRCKSSFGLKPGQSFREFGQELRELTDDDRREFVQLFNEVGMPTALPKGMQN